MLLKSDGAAGKRAFTVGIADDHTNLSLEVGKPLDLVDAGTSQCIFYGFGSDGMVGASRMAARIAAKLAGPFVQQSSWFDSKKSGGLTACHLRFGAKRIVAPYLIVAADYMVCSKASHLKHCHPLLNRLREGGTLLLNCPWSARDMERELPESVRQQIAKRNVRLFCIYATGIAARFGLGPKVNLVMLAAFFKAMGNVEYESAIACMKAEVGEAYASKGSDGWAYDIDFDGVDEVLATGENVNMLVLDTEGYSNAGGEMSKATQLGSVSGFAFNGKRTPKKRLGMMLAQYRYVYVAQVCLLADAQQAIDALREAESYEGPSVVIALCPCISWGLKGGMASSGAMCREAVSSGYWPLFGYDPRRAAGASAGGAGNSGAGACSGVEMGGGSKDGALMLDSAPPDGALDGFLAGQNRYASLSARDPELSARLSSELAKGIDDSFSRLARNSSTSK